MLFKTSTSCQIARTVDSQNDRLWNFERRGVRRARDYLLAAISAARRQATDLPSPNRLNVGTVSLQVVVA
jgi:hypothetical protein